MKIILQGNWDYVDVYCFSDSLRTVPFWVSIWKSKPTDTFNYTYFYNKHKTQSGFIIQGSKLVFKLYFI